MDYTNEEIIELLETVIDHTKAEKILNTFISAFRKYSFKKSDGDFYLHGNFNLGGTVSGRLSSSKPNLTNLPSGSKFGKLIKACFKAPKDKFFVSADYDSLEDKGSTLKTRDPNKLKVYTDNYDSHCLRAYYYFGNEMPDIKKQMNKSLLEGKFFCVTLSSGIKEYLHETDPKLKKYLNDTTRTKGISTL